MPDGLLGANRREKAAYIFAVMAVWVGVSLGNALLNPAWVRSEASVTESMYWKVVPTMAAAVIVFGTLSVYLWRTKRPVHEVVGIGE